MSATGGGSGDDQRPKKKLPPSIVFGARYRNGDVFTVSVTSTIPMH